MPKYTLSYFDGRGRGEVVRLTLVQAGVDYEDNRVKFEEWPEFKASGKCPLNQLPILELGDGTVIAQSKAIAKYIAREYGLFGSNNLETSKIDMLCEAIEDAFTTAARVIFEKDEARKAEMKTKATEESIPNLFAGLEKILSANNGGSGFFVGSQVTLADIFFYCAMEMINALPFDLTKYPKLNALNNRVAALPNIAAYLQKRPITKF